MENKLYYKVVAMVDGKYLSTNRIPDCTVEYKIGIPTYPLLINSKLFVFENKTDAIIYCDRRRNKLLPDIFVFTCKATDISQAPATIPNLTFFHRVVSFWNNNEKGGSCYTPVGTMFCGSVTLLERIY